MRPLPSKDELVKILSQAVERFNASFERESLLAGPLGGLDAQVAEYRVAHEQAVSHRLAFYLERELRQAGIVSDAGQVVVDCEYSQHLFDDKTIRVLKSKARSFLRAKRSPIAVIGRDDVYDFGIRPDILVHRRGYDVPTNLIILEVKRWTNRERAHDRIKLRLFTEPGLNKFEYVLAAAVYIRNDWVPLKRVLKVGPRFHQGKRF
jgi:hypothetical protein